MIEIITYGPNLAAPAYMTWCAAMVPQLKPGKTSKSPDPYVPGSQWLATGATEAEARGKLEAAWERAYPSKPSQRGKHMRKALSVDVEDLVL